MTESNKNIFVLDKNKDSTETASRKMAAIFAADVVGYSKLMAINEKYCGITSAANVLGRVVRSDWANDWANDSTNDWTSDWTNG